MAKDYSQYFHKPSIKQARKRRTSDTVKIDFGKHLNIKDIGKNRTYFIKTYGCQANEADTEKISGILEKFGFAQSKTLETADLMLLNTCAIRENAENHVFGELGRLKKFKKTNPDIIIGLCGCMPQEESVVQKVLKTYPQVDMVFGTHNIYKLPEYLEAVYFEKERVIEVFSEEGSIIENIPKIRAHNKKAWVNIMYGCDEFCTYCIVPYTRGKERSRHKDDIIKEVKDLIDQGYQEVTLLGQNVNSYGRDFTDRSYQFSDLLRDLSKLDIPRIRFTTSHPKDFDSKTVDVLATGGNLMPYIHLPVQSGSNSVLKRMNRKYTKESYLDLVNEIKTKIPHVSLTTDIIVGFPGETRADFEETLDLVKTCEFEGAYTFVYSKREGTPAATYEDVCTEQEKKDRLHELNTYINDGYLKGTQRFEGQTVKVLVEGPSKNDDTILAGYTENNKLVNFKGDHKYIGQIVEVKVTEAKTWFLYGEMNE